MNGADNIKKLTERQRACLELVAKGFTSKQIGRTLGISHSTVDNHILIATQALGVADRRGSRPARGQRWAAIARGRRQPFPKPRIPPF